MTDPFDLDRELAAYIEGRLTSRPPDGLLAGVLAAVAVKPQRPAWRVVDRWLPSRRAAHVRTTVAVVAVVALLAIVMIAVSLFVGSERRPAPPFGLARPGLIAFDLRGDIYVANPDGTGRRQLTFGQDADDQATWSPDGTRIAYESQLAADGAEAVVVMGPDGRNREVVADHLTDVGDLAWSPNSGEIAFSARVSGEDYHLYLADLQHSGATPLGPPELHGQDPSWSPDGSEIAFKRIGRCCSPPADTLWLIGVDGTNLRQLTGAGGGGNALWNTDWAPDGRRLAFLAVGTAARLDVYVINEDGTELRNLSASPEDEYWPRWSPDGTLIAYARMSATASNQGTLVVVAADGSSKVEFPGTPVNSNAPVWSPDGTSVAAYEKYSDDAHDANDAIAIFDLARREPPKLVDAPDFTSASWQRLAP
jgi:TolB protein